MRNFILGICILILFSCSKAQKLTFEYDKTIPQLQFAVDKINEAILKSSDGDIFYSYKFSLDQNLLQTEGFSIKRFNDNTIIIESRDVNELMYGGLDIAEQIELYGAVKETTTKPYIKKRGIKFNIPLDARTPGYDDTGDSAQKNIVEMWNWNFWEAYLDDLAVHRYNVLSLWNPHPFPSMIKLPKYPDVALDDIYVTTLKPTGKESEWAEPQMVSSNVMANIEKVKSMTIDEKIVFWKKVMNHAKNRGIDIYYFTWNVCPNSVATPVPPFYRTYNQDLWEEIPGKHGVTNQMNNPINVEYYRESVKTFLLTYPNVKGIGVTAGEHMRDQLGEFNREQWIWETYGVGMLDAQKENPNRKIDFIHRVWNTDMDKIMKYWKNYTGSFEASYKYAKARLYSSPYLSFADNHIESMKGYGLKSWWNLRNDDIFVYRWGDPDYVRAFINHFQLDHTAGFYMGSDGYVWGKEFTSKNPELSGELEIKKHWYNFMMWGRLSYDNTLDEAFFINKLNSHFPQTDANLLYTNWQTASKIIPEVNKFHWRDWDYQWAPEICIDQRTGFHEVTEFIDNPTMKGSNTLNPTAYAIAIIDGAEITKTTPLQVVGNLNTYADETLAGVKTLRDENGTAEFNTLLDDMVAMAYLGKYYAKKIEAATELALYKVSKEKKHQQYAVGHLEKAIGYWESYTEISEKNYHTQMLARTNMLDWRSVLQHVKADVEIAKNLKL
jgi:hypothetical protein